MYIYIIIHNIWLAKKQIHYINSEQIGLRRIKNITINIAYKQIKQCISETYIGST